MPLSVTHLDGSPRCQWFLILAEHENYLQSYLKTCVRYPCQRFLLLTVGGTQTLAVSQAPGDSHGQPRWRATRQLINPQPCQSQEFSDWFSSCPGLLSSAQEFIKYLASHPFPFFFFLIFLLSVPKDYLYYPNFNQDVTLKLWHLQIIIFKIIQISP